MIDLRAETKRRQEHWHGWRGLADVLMVARNGKLPLQGFGDMERYEINDFRGAHDNFVTMGAKVFGLDVPPHKGTDSAKKAAALVENVCRGYEHASRRSGGMSHERVKYWETWYLSLMGVSVRMVLLDYKNKTPYFKVRDPRTLLAPIGWSPLAGPMRNAIFTYKMSPDALKSMHCTCGVKCIGCDKVKAIDNLVDRYAKRDLDVIEYWSAEHYETMVCNADRGATLVLSTLETPGHPGVFPVVVSTVGDGESLGRTPLADVVDLQKISTTVLSMTLESIEHYLYPAIIHDPIEGGGPLKRGYGDTSVFDTQGLNGRAGRVEKIAPESPVNGFQILSYLKQSTQGLARNADSFQGQGEADSAKALSKLESGPFAYVERHLWGPQLESEPLSYEVAMTMETNCWGYDRKKIPGSTQSYTPVQDLLGYEDCIVMKPGQGAAGQAGEVTRIQKVQSKMMTKMAAFEEDPGVLDAHAWYREIQMEELDDAEIAMLMKKIDLGEADWSTLSNIKKTMEEKQVTRSEAIQILVDAGELGQPAAAMPGPQDLGALMNMGTGQDALAQGATAPSLSQIRSA